MTSGPVNPAAPAARPGRAPGDERSSVLVLGGGYTGERFAAAMAQRGVRTTATHRKPRPGAQGCSWLRFDPEEGCIPTAEELAGTTHVLVAIPPDGEGHDPVLRHLSGQLSRLPVRWLGYLSTTGVYGDQKGGWVDETSPTPATLPRSRARLACESAWRRTGLPLQVFRLPAIYGPRRTPFAKLINGSARLIHKPAQVFSRIHVDDIVGALLHCIDLPAAGRPDLLILADDCPCPSSETLGYAAHLLGRKLPKVERFETIKATMGPMASGFWDENRRVSNHLLCSSLGYSLRFPSYREGYRACLSEEFPS